MSLANKLGNIYTNLNAALNDANSALVEKGGNEVVNIAGIGDEIRNLEAGGNNDFLTQLIERTLGILGSNNLTIPDSVKVIGAYAFAECHRFINIIIPDSVTAISQYAFHNCSSLASITIPDSVTTIGDYAFRNCSSLTSVVIGDSVTSIGEEAFCSCNSLTNITIPNSVTSVDDYAFQMCSSHSSVTIGNGVTSIGDYVFAASTNLSDVYIHAPTPPTLGSYAIRSTAIIHVPVGSGDAYKEATNWSTYADNIVEDIVVE